ncbi:MAG: DEAD/DEAH box helicase [Microcoleus sp. PH2017_10_PVI_O_A]|uniref:DEAD/DEAH box helicase n=1 Tax=unclassified Microcoleus TaxID=2642155 RepID=UPI001DF7CAC7|nr:MULTISPECIES: DEAD/DEAH box helicase [unclassified Microcoleus]TAE82472.1 MAG: DEAD/DEAH box helicase [Oscillatoriales cyanobacterium]MCC3406173.1 DEAD/DEAH box helicase [Microcoleus sp. PH2017_10_PVI_O_A]MCC3460764.1 DEAD/DEAH box helicase [Microcoleus sp. PH2017_11_PCY_U_A]MCC3479327.1 DEAD/DEAH box helicase [Microcoleus sp. PH2017_12_PCY_D_A]MCC3529117.1 DEAD/DEAH box helicase [Microcoleus sp. PH2017_21_RUC_O_A]
MPNASQNRQELDLKTIFPFELDNFQRDAIAALDAGKSVVVCAPTGSGKTLIGEYAIHQALSRGRRVFYTTPLKALSNQKLRDFRHQFGDEMVGLLTGDISFNRDAPILVMTTEIFRNMLYGTPIGAVGASLTGVETVVLDECHYMNDRQRGTVWEESIIYCSSEIQLLALSATVANSDQLTDWINKVHGPTELVYSDFRPVPLQFHFANQKGVFPLLDETGKRANPRLVPKKKQQKAERGSIPTPTLTDVLSRLDDRDMLPAIYFIFSRRGCDQAVTEVGNFSLVNEAETAELKRIIDDFLQRNPEAERFGQKEALLKGIAAHHAGILPAWKGLVEELFGRGLIKVVFATETLAAGINMPARTTVISTLSKRTDKGHRLLNASEFLQMAGRAGRRGMDELGHVVAVQTRFEGAKEASYLATAKADPLASQFTPSYGMVLNLLQTHTLDEAQELVERSFGQYLSTLYLQPQQSELDRLLGELAVLEESLAAGGNVSNLEKQLAHYEKLQGRLKEDKRLLKTLLQQAEEARIKEMSVAVAFAVLGTVLSLKGKHVPTAKRSHTTPVPAVLVAKIAGSGQAPNLVCLGKDNRWYIVAISDVATLHAQLPRLSVADTLNPPPELTMRLGQCRLGSEETAAIAQSIPELPAPEPSPEAIEQQQKIAALEDKLEIHPVLEWGNPGTLLKRQRRREELKKEIRKSEQDLEKQRARYWEQFLNLIDILLNFGCLERVISAHGNRDNSSDRLVPTVLGQACAAIRGDNELWLGLSLMSAEFDELDPHHLAAACAALVTEVSRPDSWTHYSLSPEVLAPLDNLQKGLRRRLFQVQYRHEAAIPIWLERDLVTLVEQWALGVEWLELISHTSLDEGDVVRILRRTLDFLSQIPHVPHLSDSLRKNACRAMQLIDRFPVNEAATQ